MQARELIHYEYETGIMTSIPVKKINSSESITEMSKSSLSKSFSSEFYFIDRDMKFYRDMLKEGLETLVVLPAFKAMATEAVIPL